MPARLQATLMFCSWSARASIPMRARISCSRAVTVVSSGKGLVLEEPSSYHRSAVGALYSFRPVLSGDLPLSTALARQALPAPHVERVEDPVSPPGRECVAHEIHRPALIDRARRRQRTAFDRHVL